jgi:hypothetical protein
MKEHPNYESGMDCEFYDGKKRGGRILEEKEGMVLVGFHGPKYQEKWVDKTKIKILIRF